MKVYRIFVILLMIATAIVTVGCSSIDSLVRSVENTFVKGQPEVDTVRFDEAGKAYQMGNMTLAEERYKEYIEKNQRFGDNVSLAVANSQLGRIAFEKNNFRASNRYFEEAIKLDPDNLDARGLYGESLYWQKEYIRAQTLCLQALQVAPNDRRFQITLGRTMAQQKQYQAGLRYLKQALGEQGAYEEMARIYSSHSEFDKASLAMSKARESFNKQQQLASRFSGGVDSTSTSAGHQGAALHRVTQFPVAAQTQPYQPVQTAFPSQHPTTAIQQVPRQQQHVTPQQVPGYQYQYQHQYAVQQPVQPFPQQPAMMPNTHPPYHPPHNYGANYGTNDGTMNPTVQPSSPYPVVSIPQQHAYENTTQWLRDNQPPQGFAATQQPLTTAPITGSQTLPVAFRQNDREIASHSNYSDYQSGVMPQGSISMLVSSGMPSPINPLAERAASPRLSDTSSPVNPTMPMTGYWNNPMQYPVYYEHQ